MQPDRGTRGGTRYPDEIMRTDDILQQAPELWRLFTCEEEYGPSIRDALDRFPHYMSENGNPFEPRASRYLHERGFRPDYPEDHPFAVCLTHDIDVVYQSRVNKGRGIAGSLTSGRFREALATAGHLRSRRFPRCNFHQIGALEEKYGACSSFYFLAIEPGERGYNYDIRDLEEDLGTIVDTGSEVGLHGGHSAYCDPAVLETEKRRLEDLLGRPVSGYRSHFLRFRVPETWERLARAGFKYDTTLGYADCAGFRNGMCHPFAPFDLNRGRRIDILEIPLAIMDSTLDQFMRLDAAGAWEVTRTLIAAAERYNGVITVLWHNTSMFGEGLKFYEKILEYCSAKGAWMTSGAEICSWWEKNVGY
jgi:hypothetical protein